MLLFVILSIIVKILRKQMAQAHTIGHILRNIREDKGVSVQSVQAQTSIDSTLLSRIENGHRLPTIEQITQLSKVYGIDERKLLIQRESDKIVSSIAYPEIATETLQAAEAKFRYGEQYLSLFQETIYPRPIGLESRRYIGSKAKLTDWIMSTIADTTKDAHTFCDIFAGTGSVSHKAIPLYDRVIVNDFLHSNNVIYKAFFGPGEWDEEKLYDIINGYNALEPELLEDNYFSLNFGGKFYEYNLSKQIGYMRQDIEDLRPELTEKEYCILLATLIYNIDRLANTVGHFDAYIKKPIKVQPLRMRLIQVQTSDKVQIFQRDANELAREIEADIVYIDPPYNSRQYCRFYHLYETLIKWDKPELFGTALKPAPENMSRYCTSRAVNSFEDLVANLRAKYLVVSYNNTYHSKSKSSENKIRLEQIQGIMEMCGSTQVYEHDYNAFNTGKTEFEDHKELLFVTKVDEERKSKSFASLLRWG